MYYIKGVSPLIRSRIASRLAIRAIALTREALRATIERLPSLSKDWVYCIVGRQKSGRMTDLVPETILVYKAAYFEARVRQSQSIGRECRMKEEEGW